MRATTPISSRPLLYGYSRTTVNDHGSPNGLPLAVSGKDFPDRSAQQQLTRAQSHSTQTSLHLRKSHTRLGLAVTTLILPATRNVSHSNDELPGQRPFLCNKQKAWAPYIRSQSVHYTGGSRNNGVVGSTPKCTTKAIISLTKTTRNV